MANDLTNFWTTPGQDPKRAYRFLVTFPNMPNGATWYAKKCTKPSLTISEAKHSYINHTFYYPGRTEWEKVTIVLVDPVNPDAAQNIAAMIEASGYVIPSSFEEVTTISKQAANAMLGEVQIRQLAATDGAGASPFGTYVEQWTLKNAWITSVKFGELDYESDDLTSIDLELRYDFAILTSPEALASDAGIGSHAADQVVKGTVKVEDKNRFKPRHNSAGSTTE